MSDAGEYRASILLPVQLPIDFRRWFVSAARRRDLGRAIYGWGRASHTTGSRSKLPRVAMRLLKSQRCRGFTRPPGLCPR